MFDDLLFATSLGSDNHSGVHPQVMQALQAANRGYAHAYGMDELSDLTLQEFKRLFGPTVQAEYVFTGTAANVLCLAPQLRSVHAVITASTAHLNLDECGAPEKFLGSKLLTIPSQDGKISPAQAEEFFERMGDQHYAQPAAVSITQPTELGVCYTVEELKAWGEFCRQKKIMFHIDGARLSNAAAHLNISLRALTADVGADCVSFGGTKNGLMGAEVVLLFSESAKQNFKFYRKQAMQLSSKTRFLAAQFYAYLKDDLWLDIARHTTSLAQDLSHELKQFPEIQIKYPVQSNALFVQLPKSWIHPLRENCFFYIWDSQIHLCRWMISWDWTHESTTRLLSSIAEVRTCFPIK